ncbi:ThiF family adenylyltransferase [Crossiella sp. SN42]|uniref:HesA/MoeB/ThiF family protein n=1 Tax=Crossiella sp. SN42 TaxID=2944808 RepID=UPI00207C57AE|nr:ThiF family adenylyltransferase [Crossiella sp. SN42]MCO1578073.1 ThiF family adenylyltransferase [Crossiella sp. SN42]
MQRPRIKPEHLPFRRGEDLVQIGGSIYGIANLIPDPDGAVWALLARLDGTRTVDQVVTDLVRLYPEHPAGTVHTAIEALARAGHLEDAAEPPPAELSDAEQERYGRSHALWRWIDLTPRSSSWNAQLALHQARVVVVGLGGVGSAAALALTVSGVGQVHCVEPDVVELSNLNRQILFTEDDLGQPKVEAAVRRLREHNSAIEVTGQRHVIDGPQVLRQLAIGCQVLLMAADTPREIRSWTNQACLDTGTAWVHGGYHGPRVNIGLYQPGTGPCHDCTGLAVAERRAAQPQRTLWPGTPSTTAAHAASAISAGYAGLMAAHAVMSLITGAPALQTNCEYGFSLVALDDCFTLSLSAPRPDCPACGRAAA